MRTALRGGSSPLARGKPSSARVSMLVIGAHPRSRGENSRVCPFLATAWGSSPLARGKREQLPGNQRRLRLIPARAGKTPRSRDSTTRSPAHPRSRGENRLSGSVADHDAGSSPLARGKRPRFARCEGNAGLIPARAGKTVRLGVRDGRESAHPRSRGENPICRPAQCRRHRLIPARAGKTPAQTSLSVSPRAHPRSRGENAVSVIACPGTYGSSPLARGKPLRRSRAESRVRLIPARAGKTRGRSKTPSRKPAHPRSRGENRAHPHTAHRNLGSSPLARGKHARPFQARMLPGLIPARTGKTTLPMTSWSRSSAHPRSRGENTSRSRRGGSSLGSSPLARGKPDRVHTVAVAPGLIPARAGKTNTLSSE